MEAKPVIVDKAGAGSCLGRRGKNLRSMKKKKCVLATVYKRRRAFTFDVEEELVNDERSCRTVVMRWTDNFFLQLCMVLLRYLVNA